MEGTPACWSSDTFKKIDKESQSPVPEINNQRRNSCGPGVVLTPGKSRKRFSKPSHRPEQTCENSKLLDTNPRLK
ncbi:hypothetical protein BH11ARM1_BH11ARM1_15950 [soil metagenome]